MKKHKHTHRQLLSVMAILVILTALAACASSSAPHSSSGSARSVDDAKGIQSFSDQEISTLSSLKQVDDYPLYTMHFSGAYERDADALQSVNRFRKIDLKPVYSAESTVLSSCSLFAALGKKDGMVYGRNFDWKFSPALLLFADPPDGYASVSMVDIAYLGFTRGRNLCDLPIVKRRALLDAPFLPFDGMNEWGLVVAMAAVPGGNLDHTPGKEVISCILVIRKILDTAKTVEEAVGIIGSYNIDMGGLRLHYLIADTSGKVALVEFYRKQMQIFPNEQPWHLATNFQIAAISGSPQDKCRRYDRMRQKLIESQGALSSNEAMALLESVSKWNTEWSIVYGMSTGLVTVAMDRKFGKEHSFHLGHLTKK